MTDPSYPDVAEENQVDAKSANWKAMSGNWAITEPLREGTEGMRAAGELLLPIEPKETQTHWNNRIARSFLFAGYLDAIDDLSSLPFQEPVKCDNPPTGPLADIIKNVDRKGTDLTTFLGEILAEGIDKGMTNVLVDYPTMDESATLAEERAIGARPIFIHITAKNLIGYRSKVASNGQEILTQIRISEEHKENAGLYGQQCVNYVRVYNDDQTWELWRQDPKTEKYILSESGRHTYPGIPIRTLYLNRKDFMLAKSCLMSLAWLNIAHWQSSSDQRNCLRFARVGLLFAAGFTDEQVEKGLVIGPSSIISTENPAAKLSYVEHQGGAITSGERDLEKLEKQMEHMGKKPLMPIAGKQTATEKSINEGRSTASLQNWVRELEIFARELFQVAATWIKGTIPDLFKVNIYTEFTQNLGTVQDLAELRAARDAGDLDHQTWIEEVKRRGLLSESVTTDTVKERLKSDPPPRIIPGAGNGQNTSKQGSGRSNTQTGGMGG